MQLYTVIVENDQSDWNDDTGRHYHFPKRYLSYLTPGTKVIYYKGRMKDKAYQSVRLSTEPHYFGMATIKTVQRDPHSTKNDYYIKLSEFNLFSKAVPAFENKIPIEVIPPSRETNYWRDGVRPIAENIYQKIIEKADLIDSDIEEEVAENQDCFYAPKYIEGAKTMIYTTKYERDRNAREQVVNIHGTSCMACGFNFQRVYGDWGKDFIHVHHLKPISSYGGGQGVNPETDFIVLCPNCHAMVHRKRNNVLGLEELKKLIYPEA